MVRMAFVLLAALPVSDAALGQNDARLTGCLGFTSPLRDRLGTCKMLAAAPAIDAVSRTEADRHASRIMLALKNWSAMLADAAARLSRDPLDAIAHDRKARALLGQGGAENNAWGLAATEEGLRHHPSDTALLTLCSFALFPLRRRDEALATVDQAPENLLALNVKAFALERRNEANELLRRARARDASAQDAARNLVLELAR